MLEGVILRLRLGVELLDGIEMGVYMRGVYGFGRVHFPCVGIIVMYALHLHAWAYVVCMKQTISNISVSQPDFPSYERY